MNTRSVPVEHGLVAIQLAPGLEKLADKIDNVQRFGGRNHGFPEAVCASHSSDKNFLREWIRAGPRYSS